MAKAKKGELADSGKKKTRIGQIILAVVVVGAVIAAFVLKNSGSSSGDSTAGNDASAELLKDPSPLRNRMVLPAQPQIPRPVTLDPAGFPDPDIKVAYQAAKDSPDALEHVACYCGCFASSGHRNNLDCFKDQHGAT